MIRVYFLSLKKYQVVDEIFSKFHKQNRMSWMKNHTSSDYSIFVIWWDAIINETIIKKNCVIVDLKNLNKIMKSNIYLISLQFNIIQVIVRCSYISILDAANFFYQWHVFFSHCKQLSVVSHKDQEIFNVAVMSFCNSITYVQ